MKYITIVASNNIQDRYPLNKQQINFFKKRQRQHEYRAKKNALRLARICPKIASQLLKDASTHDKSKWGKNEYFAYVWLTAVMNMPEYKGKYPSKELEKYVDEKWKHHYLVNGHHPEHWIAKGNLAKMPLYQIAHMVADWAAMSQEFGTSLKQWWKHQASRKYKWTNQQRKIIEEYISNFPELK